jgi:hypothetical protein
MRLRTYRVAIATRMALWLPPLLAMCLLGCQTQPLTTIAAPVPAPALVVGDHWQYRITDNLRRGALSTLDIEVTAITNGVASLRMVTVDANGKSEMTEEMNSTGGLVAGALKEDPVRRFPTPVTLFDFPLEDGKSWRQVIDTISPETGLRAQILNYGTVRGQTTSTAPAGTVNVIFLARIIQLDDEQFWRTRTERRDSVWYAAQFKAPLRENREAQYTWLSGGAPQVVRTESTIRELVSFRPGPR